MKNSFVEIRIATSVDAGDLLALLEETFCLGCWEQDGGVCLYWASEIWNERALAAIKGALKKLGDPQAVSTLTIADLPDRDWNASWSASIKPVQLGRRILIRQSWNPAEAPAGGFALVIDPGRAFGTGYHATTQLIAERLEDLITGGERILDVGTGSGILAMVALRLGARSALGIDHDPEAIECAAGYALLNDFGSELELRVAALEDIDPEPFDLIVANLDRRALLGYFAALRGFLRPGGRMLVSGLLSDDWQEIVEALAKTGWQVLNRRDEDEWLALELQPQAEQTGDR